MNDKDGKATTEFDGDLIRTRVKLENDVASIDAEGVHYRSLNALLRTMNGNGVKKIEIRNVYGQRYIGTDLDKSIDINVYGTPGNDLGAFMNGSSVFVYGNVQDGCGNTMNNGLIAVHGHAGDICGYSMRGGKIYVRDDVGYRAGIHMKEHGGIRPCMVIGGRARDFLGEYMAGGVIVLGLNLEDGADHEAKFVGTGMHGGVIYVHGEIRNLGVEVEMMEVDRNDLQLIHGLAKDFCGHFNLNFDEILSKRFMKIVPVSHRPYGRLYAY